MNTSKRKLALTICASLIPALLVLWLASRPESFSPFKSQPPASASASQASNVPSVASAATDKTKAGEPSKPGLKLVKKRKAVSAIDVRAVPATADIPAEKVPAVEALRRALPGAVVDYDARTGTPARLQVTGGFLTPPSSVPQVNVQATVENFVERHTQAFGHGPAALRQTRVTREDVTAHNGMVTKVWQQEVEGVPVFDAIFKANLTKDGRIITLSSHFIAEPKVELALANATLDATAALRSALAALEVELDMGSVRPLGEPSGTEHKQRYEAKGISDTTVQLTYMPMDRQRLRAAYDITTFSLEHNEMFRSVVDADTGDILYRQSLTADISNASYRVYADGVSKQPFDSPMPMTPGHTTPSSVQPPEVPRQLLTLDALDTTASPEGWIPDGGTTTVGNNVHAHTDVDADNQPDLPRPTSPTRQFDFPVNFSASPTTYQPALVTQLFYMNNWIHDKLYALGFTESAGNFQTNNFGRGGLGNDAVQADAQDGSGINNANFSTPADGSPGRMQMFIWTAPDPDRDSDFDNEIIIHEYVHGLSNRLVGGGVGISALQSRGMGEGWSDFYAITLLSQESDGVDSPQGKGGYSTYLLSGMTTNYYFGIRRYPYSPDMSKSPLTYQDIEPGKARAHNGVPLSPRYSVSNGSPDQYHAQGEVWCNMLWDVRRNLILKHGYAIGNQLVLQIVTDGMKLSPANPSFLQARDAIIQADLVNNAGANSQEIWAGFAKRGMGLSATGPGSSTTIGITEAYDVPGVASLSPASAFAAAGVQGGEVAPESMTFTLSNTGAGTLNWTAAKTQPWTDLSATSGSLAPGSSVTLTWTINASASTLPTGEHRDLLTITDTATGLTQTRPLLLELSSTPVAQTITFAPLPPRLTTSASFDLTATASSGLPVSFTLVTGPATLDGSTLSLTGTTGVVSIRASQPGSAVYLPAPDVVRSFFVGTSQQFAKVSSGPGSDSTYAIKADGTLWTWGYSPTAGHLADTTSPGRISPAQIGTATNWTDVAAGGDHGLALRSDGTLWSWGSSSSGQIGDGMLTTRTSPVQIGIGFTWTAISAGTTHSAAVRSNGTLWTWGLNSSGQLGHGGTISVSTPTQVGSATNWVKVSCGVSHTVALNALGELWAWGSNTSGQLGDGTTTQSNSPVKIGTATDWAQIASGSNHTLALKTNGTLWGWGSGASGQLGDGTGLSRTTPTQTGTDTDWTSITAGTFSSGASKADGSLWVMGANTYGQLGDGTFNSSASPIPYGAGTNWLSMAMGRYHSVALRTDGVIMVAGESIGFSGVTPRSLALASSGSSSWLQLSGSSTHFVAIQSNRSLWGWGMNSSGQVGNNSTTDVRTLTQIGTAFDWQQVSAGGNSFFNNFTLGIKTSGTLWGWGYNVAYNLGNGTTTSVLVPTQIGADTNWKQVSAGTSHGMAVKTNGTLWGWGSSASHQLGNGSTSSRTTAFQTGTDTNWSAVACGGNFSLGLKTNGTLWAWGSNTVGQLGDSSINQPTPVQVGSSTLWIAIACGTDHAVALRSDGTLWTWGGNARGQLGHGHTTNLNSPQQVGTATNWVKISAGPEATAAINSLGEIWTCGANHSGQQANGQTTNQTLLTRVCADPSFSHVAMGTASLAAIRADGSFWTAGSATSRTMGGGRDPRQLSTLYPLQGQTLDPIATNYKLYESPVRLTASSGLPVGLRVKSGPATASGNALTLTGSGTVTFSAFQFGDESGWDAIPPTQFSFTVDAGLAVTFPAPGSTGLTVGGFSATGVVLSPTLGFAPELGTLLTLVNNTGTSPINGTLPGIPQDGFLIMTFNGISYGFRVDYTGGDGNDIVLTHEKAPQTIQIATITPKETTDAPFPISATSTGGLPITWSVVTGPATVVGNVVTVTGAGAVTLKASQAGNDLFFAAPDALATFAVGTGVRFTGIYSGASSSSALAVAPNGTLWGWGSNSLSQLGNGSSNAVPYPAQSSSTTGWTTISMGSGFASAIKSDGTAWAWGSNASGQVGDGTTTTRSTPTQVLGITGATALATGNGHSLIRRNNGTLWAWGFNSSGQIGDGTTTNKTLAVQIGSDTDWATIGSGVAHSLAIKNDGSLWAWGFNSSGQLGLGDTTNRTAPVRVGLDNDWAAVTGGSNFTIARKTNGTLWAWGFNSTGQLGTGNFSSQLTPVQIGSDSDWVAISAGSIHVVALKADGSLWAWGSNGAGQLGLGHTTNISAPTRVGADIDWVAISAATSATYLRKSDGTVWCIGHGNPLVGTKPRSLTRAAPASAAQWQQLTAGFSHQLGVRTDGSLWALGSGGSGQLGNGFFNDVRSWTRIGTLNTWQSAAAGDSHSLAIRKDGTLWAWGSNGSGQLGDGTTTTRASPVQVSTSTDWATIDGGGFHTLAIKTDGTLWAWGSNGNGRLGDGTTVQRNAPVQIGSANTWRSVAAGSTHSAGIRQDGSLWTWGFNSSGQLGLGNTTSQLSPVRVGTDNDWAEVDAGVNFTVARKTNGTLWVAGSGATGVLGNGTFGSTLTFSIVPATGWRSVRAGANHILGIHLDGSVLVWGEGLYGQLMNGSTANASSPQTIAPTSGWLQAIPSGYHNLFLRNDGSFWAGGNSANFRTGEAGRDYRLPAPVVPGLSPQSINTTPVGTGPYRITATSGLPVQLALVSGQATISGDQINPTGPAGAPIVVVAWQPGDENAWDAAPPVELVLGIPVGPTVTTVTHSQVTGSGVRLEVTANPNQLLTTYLFEYGTDPDLTTFTSTTPQVLGSSATSTSAAFTLTGLQENTTYYYRALVSSIGGTATSSISNFTTLQRDIAIELTGGPEATTGQPFPLGDISMASTQTYTFTVRNITPASTITLGTPSLSGPDTASYTLVTTGMATTLSGGQSTTFTIHCRPLALGTRTVTLTLPNNDPDESPFLLLLSANAVAIPGPGQTISGPDLPVTRFVSQGPFTLSYLSTSGLPVTYTVAGGTGGTVTGSTFTPSSSGGAVTIRISQPGGSGYDPAPDLYRTFTVAEGTFTKLAVGSQANHGIGIKADGTLWAWGGNSNGQIGNGSTTDAHAPVKIGTATNWASAAVGANFTIAIRTDGTLWSWGGNSSGQLGHGNTTQLSIPTQVGTATTWAEVAAGASFVIARRTDGTLWAWGSNVSGQLGLNDTTTRTSPTQVGTATTWAAVAAGASHALARRTDGTLWSWGLNSSSQLGQGNTTDLLVPTQVGSNTTWTKIACASNSSFALLDFALYAWGNNTNSTLGDNTTTNRSVPTLISSTIWLEIAGGNEHALAIRADGSLWSWGGVSGAGPQGHGDRSTRRVPTRVGTESNWTAVSAGPHHSLAIRSNGTLWSAGGNDRGQLAYPDVNPVPIATGGVKSFSAGTWYSHFIKQDGTLWAVGSNVNVHGDGTSTRRPMPIQIGTDTDWQTLSTGQAFTFALKTDGSLWAAGLNSNGQLGDGTTVTRSAFTRIGTATWAKVAGGLNHALGIQTDGSLWAWGLNSSSQLGDGTTTNRLTPVRIGTANDWADVEAGELHSVALKTNGTLWTWGGNTSGQLGNGSFASHTSPVQLSGAAVWTKISAGTNCTLALRSNGTLWAWGLNSTGQLGDGTTTNRLSPVQIGSATDWAEIDAELDHTLALRTNGTAFGWGGSFYAQSGHSTVISSPQIILGGHSIWSKLGHGYAVHTLIQSSDGTLWGFGSNADYQTTSAARVNSLFDYAHPGITTQTITFPGVTIPAYNVPVTLNATATSGLPVDYYVSGPASLSGNQLTITGPGQVKLFAAQTGARPVWHNTPVTQASISYAIADLQSLTVSTGSLFPAFDPTTTQYSSRLPVGVTSTIFTPTLAEPGASVTVNSVPVTSGSPSGPVSVSSGSTINVVVTSQNLAVTKTYQITFTSTTPFMDWAAANSITADPNADPDGDGIANLLEFSYGLSPTLPTSDPMEISGSIIIAPGKPTIIPNPNGPGMLLLYPRLTSFSSLGMNYTVHFSDDLLHWQTNTATPTLVASNGTVDALTLPFPVMTHSGKKAHLTKVTVTAP